MPTSNTYNFQSVQIELLIRDAYENIGIAPEFITPQKLESARRSLNLILIEWMNKSTNLWTLHNGFIALEQGKNKYTLENYVSDITEVNLRTSNRQLNGTAASSNGGVSANAFDGNSATTCTQDAPNGNISYDYGAGKEQNITFCGITSHVTLTYSLSIEVSNDNVNWQNVLAIPTQVFTAGQLYWFDIAAPTNSRYYRIRETGGKTLNIQEIYFNNNVLDTTISSISRDEYLKFPQKNIKGRPSIYYFDKSITPSISLWPSPASPYNAISYSYKKMMQDVGLYTNTIEIPSRFYPALTAALSYKLAIKFNSQVADILSVEYQNSFNLATIEDTEDVNITIRPEWH
jgi:hypothetical protein